MLVVATIIVAGSVGVHQYRSLRPQQIGLEVWSPSDPINVPLWVPPAEVRHKTRFASLWDGQAPLARFRQAENLDAVARGAASDEERARKLLHWTRAQFEPGRPDPYPPPDAMKTLSEIRAGRTGGFCAQYAFVLVQALQSFGKPARVVTIESHEVVETWLADQGRWTMLDPLFDLQVIDQSGRSLSAIEIRNARHAGATLAVTAGDRLTEPLRRYAARYDRIALWIRNAFVSAPENFTDFDRYRVWLVRSNEVSPSPESLSTTHPEGLYSPPNDFPAGTAPSGAPAEFQRTPTSDNKERSQPRPSRENASRSRRESLNSLYELRPSPEKSRLDALWISAWRRTFRDEPPKALAILSREPVERVDEGRESERAKDAAERSGELDLGEEHDAPTPVARDWRAIAEYEPPTFAAPFLRHRSEQATGVLIRERKQCQFFASVERGDDPRRPTAEPSAAGIEQNRAREVRGGR